MIIILICLGILLVGIVLGVIYRWSCLDWCTRETIGFCSIFFAIFGGLASVVAGTTAIVNNCSAMCLRERMAYEEKVVELNATYDYLMKYDDASYARYTAIQQYNAEVREFKTDILKQQNALNNPWISWFTCKEYKNMDANAVQYITLLSIGGEE